MVVEIQTVYRGTLRCEATHGPSRTTLITDAPLDNHGKGESYSPTDLVATALATCMMTIMGIIASKMDLDLEGSTVRIEKHMVKDPHRRIGSLPVEITLPIEPSEAQREELQRAALTCPVMMSVSQDIEKNVRFKWKQTETQVSA